MVAAWIASSHHLDLIGANGVILMLGTPLFIPSSSVQGERRQRGRIVVAIDFRPGSTNTGLILSEPSRLLPARNLVTNKPKPHRH